MILLGTGYTQGSGPYGTGNLFVDTNSGVVGIGTNNPDWPLDVDFRVGTSSVGFHNSSSDYTKRRYMADGIHTFNPTWSTPAYSIVSSGVYGGLGYVAYSDKRIKKNIIDLNDNESLNLINQIDVKKYKYKDIYERGISETYGFIAQQVESVIPLATGNMCKHIPSIYELANISLVNGNVLITTPNSLDLGNTEIYGNLSDPLNFRFYDGDDSRLDYNVIKIDDHTLQLDGNFSISNGNLYVENKIFTKDKTTDINSDTNINGNISGNIYVENKIVGNIAGDKLFVYGPKVDDFKTVNKDKIFTVGISAIQELNRKNTTLENKVTTLETQLSDVLNRLAALESN